MMAAPVCPVCDSEEAVATAAEINLARVKLAGAALLATKRPWARRWWWTARQRSARGPVATQCVPVYHRVCVQVVNLADSTVMSVVPRTSAPRRFNTAFKFMMEWLPSEMIGECLTVGPVTRTA